MAAAVPCSVVIGRRPADPPARIPARTISAVAFGSVISSGIERTSTPSIAASSFSSMSQPSRMPTPERAPKWPPTAAEVVSTPITARHSSAIPRNAFPETMGE